MKKGKNEKNGQMMRVEKELSIKRFLHMQFIKIGVIVGIAMGILGIFAIYEGVELARYNSEAHNLSVGQQTTMTVVLVGVVVVISILLIDKLLNRIALKTISRISHPVGIMDDVMKDFAAGKLGKKIEYDMSDEFSNMMTNATLAMTELKTYINDISDTLQEISDKNMDIGVEREYIGDFSRIHTSLVSIIESLNNMIYEMRASFVQVRDGAGSLAETAQSMADGAEQQSVDIKELVDHIEKVSGTVHKNAIAAQGVETLSHSSTEKMEEGGEKMNELAEAMDQIREESNEIASIIEVITGIAAQTNLLALNASIEAARAGEHGKGFAVVASEIGALASSSAEAAQNITELIQKSIAAVDHGVAITSETVEMLGGISEISAEIAHNITDITDESKNQDDYLKGMLDNANDIAAVIDQNTAAAQESSALSEQLLGYADNVMSLIEQYKIRER